MSLESIALLPVILSYLPTFASSLDHESEDTTSLSVSLVYSSKNGDCMMELVDDLSDTHFNTDESSKVFTDVLIEVPFGSCSTEVYLFKDWTSSTGLLFSVLLIYIGLATITNIIVVYKFIATWNQITVSLREQNRVCAKYAAVPSTRRQTCQEALKPSRYSSTECSKSAACPICLLDLQNQDFVVACDDGCETKFHKECLYDWLEYKDCNDTSVIVENNTSCPCCRKELLGIVITELKPTESMSGFVSELSTLVGYYPY